MAFWRSAIVALAMAALPGAAAGQGTGTGYDGDLIQEPWEPRPRPTRHVATAEQRRAAEAALAGFTSPTLTRFAGEDEFRRYAAAVQAVNRARHGWYAASGQIRFAQALPQQGEVQSDATGPLCPEDQPDCEAAAGEQNVVVTGSRIAPRNPSITNNQMRGVEEGDIVKQIGHYLIVLQDGRLFVIDIEARGGRGLALADRVDIYRNPRADTWYDEMLVRDDRLLVLGYSYDEGMSEVAVFRLSEAGRLTNDGIFHISSGDYYSSSNYATRLIGDSLIIYTPFEIGTDGNRPFALPVIRRWIADEEREAARSRGRPIIDARNIYRPVRATDAPTVHTVSVCPLGPIGPGEDFECRTTGFIGPRPHSWYVTGDDVFLWTQEDEGWSDSNRECRPGLGFTTAGAEPALLYRVPVIGGTISVAGTRGQPSDQFSLYADAGRFRAILQWRPQDCRDDYASSARLVYLTTPLAGLSGTLAELPRAAYTALPPTGSQWTVNRFTERYLVYGGLSRFRRGLPDLAEYERERYDPEYIARIRRELSMPPAYVMPIDRPSAVRPLNIRHTLIRAEQAGNDIVLTGYRDRAGLSLTLIDLDAATPRIASQVRLHGRYESEGRSHAFNSLIAPDGSGLMGLPTVARVSDSGREYWRSRASDLSFLEVDPEGLLSPIGELSRRFNYADDGANGEEDEDGVPGYTCEVSCIDWYGNSRPIFTDGRVFALSGAELIEGRVSNGRIFELRRLNFALAPPAGR